MMSTQPWPWWSNTKEKKGPADGWSHIGIYETIYGILYRLKNKNKTRRSLYINQEEDT